MQPGPRNWFRALAGSLGFGGAEGGGEGGEALEGFVEPVGGVGGDGEGDVDLCGGAEEV